MQELKKTCSVCKNELLLTEFLVCGKRKDGSYRYSPYCRSCNKMISKQNRIKNRDYYNKLKREERKIKRNSYQLELKEKGLLIDMDLILNDISVYCKCNRRVQYNKEYLKEYHKRPEVREKIKEYNRKPEAKEKTREYFKRPEVREKIREYNKRPYVRKKHIDYIERQLRENKEYKIKILKYARNYYKLHIADEEWRGKRNNYMRNKYATDLVYRARMKENSHNRRRLVKESNDDYIRAVSEIEGNKNNICYWCGKPIDKSDLSIDHIIPLSRDGTNTKDNIVAAHIFCNTSKNNKLPWEYLKYCLEENRPINEKFIIKNKAIQTILL